MGFDAVAALLTTVVALVLTLVMGLQYASRRRTHALWWSISFLATAVAAFLQFMALTSGTWNEGTFRLYVMLAAAIPALMGAGSMYLLWRRLAPVYTAVALVFIALGAVGALSASLTPALLSNVMKASSEVTVVLPSAMLITAFAVLGTIGGAALVLGALWSLIRTKQLFNLGIIIGGIVFSLADTLAGNGVAALFFAAQIVGILAIFIAVRASQQTQAASQAERAPEAHN